MADRSDNYGTGYRGTGSQSQYGGSGYGRGGMGGSGSMGGGSMGGGSMGGGSMGGSMGGSSRGAAFGRSGHERGFGASGTGTALQLAPLVVGGALAAVGIRRGGWLGYGMALAGLGVMQQAFTGKPDIAQWTGFGADHDSRAVTVTHTVTINKPAEDLYRFWRNFANLPRFMNHIERVDIIDDRRSHWVAKAPAGLRVEWEAEVTDEQEGRRIAWRAMENADVPNWGHVEFRPAPGGRGTEVHAVIRYEPPAGALGRAVARILGEEPQVQMREDLNRFKRLMETGEAGTGDSATSARAGSSMTGASASGSTSGSSLSGGSTGGGTTAGAGTAAGASTGVSGDI
ncbi:MAG TPA: SRPBCC family protein [Azospirillaceae bacterium]|nr:SRPBCC family protein [Azospirillaceae bacterium]